MLQQCITAIHTDTWFVVEGQESDVCRTTAGSRPGGNDLLGFCLEAIVALAVQQRTGILEHPAEPEGKDHPSIWCLPIVQLIAAIPGVARLRFAQGLLGTDSPKPTEVLAVNLPALPLAIQKWRVTPDLPRQTNIGRGRNGEFKTTQLKEYSPALRAAFAESTVSALQSMTVDEEATVDEQFLHQCHSMVNSDFG